MHTRQFIVLPVLILIGFALLSISLFKLARHEFCETDWPQLVTGPSGDSIEMDTEFCGLLTGDPGTITLRYNPSKSSATNVVFAYTPSSDYSHATPPWYPTVTWDAPGRVLISIRVVDQIEMQSFAVGKTSFVYQIGRIEYQRDLNSK